MENKSWYHVRRQKNNKEDGVTWVMLLMAVMNNLLGTQSSIVNNGTFQHQSLMGLFIIGSWTLSNIPKRRSIEKHRFIRQTKTPIRQEVKQMGTQNQEYSGSRR